VAVRINSRIDATSTRERCADSCVSAVVDVPVLLRAACQRLSRVLLQAACQWWCPTRWGSQTSADIAVTCEMRTRLLRFLAHQRGRLPAATTAGKSSWAAIGVPAAAMAAQWASTLTSFSSSRQHCSAAPAEGDDACNASSCGN